MATGEDLIGGGFVSKETLREHLGLTSIPKPELAVWYGSMPESNGKSNWTATLYRKGGDFFLEGFCFARSEYPDRVRYEADRMKWIIGENANKPHILDYDADLRSDYVEPTLSPDTDVAEWLISVNDHSVLLYTLKDQPDRRGRVNQVNDLMVRIENANGSKHDLSAVAARIMTALQPIAPPTICEELSDEDLQLLKDEIDKYGESRRVIMHPLNVRGERGIERERGDV